MKYKLQTYLFENVETDLLTGEWIDVPLADLPEENLKRLWDNYSTCYTKHGLDLSVSDAQGLRGYTGVFLMDEDEPPDGLSDAFIIYKQKGSYGKKLSLLGTCTGPDLCNALKEAKTAVVKKLPEANSGRYFFYCSSVPPSLISSPAISARVPKEPAAKKRLESSSVTTHIATLPIPNPA